MSDPLAALRRKAHELDCLARDFRTAGDVEMAVHHENDAAIVAARIETLEHADGNAYGIAMDGQVTA